MPVLQFKGKTAVECHHHTVPHHTLEFDSKLSVLGKGEKPGLDGNLIIEGDNLIALKALLPTQAGRIKCIYIDPPYNTGNEGWVYNDNLTQPQFKEWIGQTVGKEGEDATRHDKWCCMIYPRLQLLRELLSDDGAIFVSIDDNELKHLRMLMDEIFGEENFVAQVSVLSNPKGRVLKEGFARTHDYLVVYRKHLSRTEFSTEKSEDEIKEQYQEVDERGKFRFLELRNTHRKFGKHNRPNDNEPIQRSLYDYVSDDMNEYEKSVALFLDNHPQVLWWYRNLVGPQCFSIQGFKRNKVYPDFVVQQGRNKKPVATVAVVESKGKHLKGNEDTTYKRAVAGYFEKIGRKVPWQKLAEDFQDETFRFQVLDEGEYEDRDWRDDLRRLLQAAVQI